MPIKNRTYVLSNGCPESRIDAAHMLEYLKKRGWSVSQNIRGADLIVFFTCGNTKDSENLSIEIIKSIQAGKRPGARFIVSGCLPKINARRLREVYQGNTFGSGETDPQADLWEAGVDADNLSANYLLPCTDNPILYGRRFPNLRKLSSLVTIQERLTAGYFQRYNRVINVFRPDTFCIKVSTGCLNACAYCAIRYSRGRVRSKPIAQVCEEFKKGLTQGYEEFALIGTDLGAYGKDVGTDLACLLDELIQENGDFKIRVRNIQPRFLIEMMPRMREIFRSGKISYLSTAAESGNNRILKSMRRGYRIEDFKRAMGILNREFPDIQIRTQLIIGFPGETEEEFRDTLGLLDQMRFDYIETYVFQPRPNTEAAEMEDQIPEKTARKRRQRLVRKALFDLRGRRKKALKDYKVLRNKRRSTLSTHDPA